MSEGLGLQRPAIGVISIAAAFLSAVALNHQSAEDVYLNIPKYRGEWRELKRNLSLLSANALLPFAPFAISTISCVPGRLPEAVTMVYAIIRPVLADRTKKNDPNDFYSKNTFLASPWSVPSSLFLCSIFLTVI